MYVYHFHFRLIFLLLLLCVYCHYLHLLMLRRPHAIPYLMLSYTIISHQNNLIYTERSLFCLYLYEMWRLIVFFAICFIVSQYYNVLDYTHRFHSSFYLFYSFFFSVLLCHFLNHIFLLDMHLSVLFCVFVSQCLLNRIE